MKYLMFFCGLILIASCTKPDLLSTYDAKVGDTIEHNKELTIKIDSIRDSRCPTGALCGWEGQVEVFIVATPEKEIAVQTKLTLIESLTDQEELDIFGFKLRLLSVDPYPIVDEILPEEDYNIRMLVE